MGRVVMGGRRQRTVPLEPAQHDPAAYDLVVVWTPVYANTLPAEPRSYLVQQRDKLERVAFFCTGEDPGECPCLRSDGRGVRAQPRGHAALPRSQGQGRCHRGRLEGVRDTTGRRLAYSATVCPVLCDWSAAVKRWWLAAVSWAWRSGKAGAMSVPLTSSSQNAAHICRIASEKPNSKIEPVIVG